MQESERDIHEFIGYCHSLCTRILRLFGKGLEVFDNECSSDHNELIQQKVDDHDDGEGWFVTRHDHTLGKTGSVRRWLHVRSKMNISKVIELTRAKYPAIDGRTLEVGDIRAGAHSE